MIFVFDLDGTICSINPKGDVYAVRPYKDRIIKINRLYEKGHTIIIDTARGTQSGVQHQEKTEAQLKVWGVKYHILRTGVKFYGDAYIDDKAMKDSYFFN